MIHGFIRGLLFVVGGLLLLGAVGAVAIGETGAAIESTVLGAGLMIVAVLQRSRYRSEAAERFGLEPGPGGGESQPLEPRFAPTDEMFVDPPSGRIMRVYVDQRTGERRYVAER